ncbi:MAG: hypothetical protein H6550_16195 [Chitinophagales bacterium]|nr:hypothetical protein [Chitinophagales bacterium]
MKYTNEFMARLYASYWGCLTTYVDDEGTPCRVDAKTLDFAIQENFANGKLVLTPLSKITAMDRLVVAKIITGNNIATEGKVSGNTYTYFVDCSKSIDAGIHVNLKFSDFVGRIAQSEGWLAGFFGPAVLDYLRMRGYLTEYTGVNGTERITIWDLVDAGLAITKSE